MDVVLFCLALLGLAAYVAAPLYRRGSAPLGAASRREPDTRSAALADLEIDRASGLLDAADYERERQALERND